jgi:hypothetical protein
VAGTGIIAEQLGIPSVVVAAPGFELQAKLTGRNNAVPVLQVAVYPGAFDTHSDSELKENTKKTVFPQIVDLLTKPIKADETAVKITGSRSIVFTGTFDEVNRYFSDQKWSDGLPIVPPTRDRVVEFLKYTDYPPTEEIAVLRVANLRATPWNIAVNGVMAGCRPEFMPLLIAYVKAIGDPVKGPGMYFGSTHSWIPYLWVNGPLARQLDIDHGQGLIGYSTNRVLGRALGLIVRNLAGFRIKETAMGTYGYTIPWVLAEDEKFLREIGWEPYHVEKGFDRRASTVTASTATAWGQNNIPALSISDVTTVMQLIAREMTYKESFASGQIGVQRVELISPPVAKVLAAGYTTKQSLIEDLIKHVRKPTYEAAFSKFFGSFGLVYGSFEEVLNDLLASPDAEKGKLPPWYGRFPGWEEIVTTPCIRADRPPEILVCGDANRNKTQTLPGGSVCTREVELPAKWDKLMSDLGYPALSECYID